MLLRSRSWVEPAFGCSVRLKALSVYRQWGDPLVAVDGRQVVAGPGTSKPASILIVEDEALVASCIEEVLGELGFSVAGIAASGAEAIALAAASRPTLALVDIRLTGSIDGIELACRLRQELGVPSIFLSGLADATTTLRAEAAQALGFLAKPFRPSQVFNAIQRALQPQGD
jgi:CheY-like chemotaxis protein